MTHFADLVAHVSEEQNSCFNNVVNYSGAWKFVNLFEFFIFLNKHEPN